MSRPAKAGATDEVRPAPPTPLWRCVSSTPKAGGFTAAAASADRAMRAGRVPRMPRWLRQPRHGSRAWYCPFTLASGSDPRHESRVALLVPRGRRRAGVLLPRLPRRRLIPVRHLARRQRAVLEVDLADHAGRDGTALGEVRSDEELRVGRQIDATVVHRLAHELAVEVHRELAAVPRRRHLVPLAGFPLRDRRADAARDAVVVEELEAQEVDVLDHLEAAVAELDEGGVVVIAFVPAGLKPERHGAGPAGDLLDVGDFHLRIGRVLRGLAAVEGDVRAPRWHLGGGHGTGRLCRRALRRAELVHRAPTARRRRRGVSGVADDRRL